MGWLTLKALELDEAEVSARRKLLAAQTQTEEARRNEEAARRRAELEEDINRALWRMDTWLTPLIAQEAARPYYAYRTVYTMPVGSQGNGTKGSATTVKQEVSPLIVNPSQHVLLNWQITEKDQITSPQHPADEQIRRIAIDNGATLDSIDVNGQRLEQLGGQIDYKQLWAILPEENLPPVEVSELVWNKNWEAANNSGLNNIHLGLAQLDQQVEESQKAQQRLQQESQGGQQAAPAPNAQPAAQSPNGQQGQRLNPPQGQSAAQRYNDFRDRQDQMLRGGVGFERRNRAFQQFANRAVTEQRVNTTWKPSSIVVKEGVSRPLWIGSNLLLARRVTVGDRLLVQGCWLDWPMLERELLAEVADLLPDAHLVAVDADSEVNPARMLATLPVRLVVPDAAADVSTAGIVPPIATATLLSPIRISLCIAWGCMILATIAVAVLLLGVVSLSERRASFVAAVTHELRTPLTTFRMYAEMLSEGMLKDEAKRQHYLETLRIEADRLTHLVTNVLAYARLERGRPGGRREKICLGDLIRRASERLGDRAGQAEMQLVVQADEALDNKTVRTDPAAVEQILFNLVDNACKYALPAEDRRIHLQVDAAGRSVRIRVRDHGPGISDKAAGRLFRPFSKSVHDAANSAPGVGLGLALCHRLARDLGGQLEIEKPDGNGASFVLALPAR